jgi:fatty-acyl-CoA synthase
MNTAEELKHYITDSGAKVAITTADLAPELAKASNACRSRGAAALVVTSSPTALMPMCKGRMRRPKPGATGCWPARTRKPESWRGHAWTRRWPAASCRRRIGGRDDLALLPYTSGTTGLPKGCMHLHRSINHNAFPARCGHGHQRERVLAVVPMFHITGMVSVLHSAIYMGAT